MQGVLSMPPGEQQLGYTLPHKITEATMDLTTKKLNQSDSGIFSATSNSTDIIDCSSNARTVTQSDNESSDINSDRCSPDSKLFCPVCERKLTSQHELTLHIRSHNNDDQMVQDPDKGYTCRICSKVLSSSSSLDRHVLVHSGERPFTCRYCGDTFTTNGNMHRHMRTHKNESYESDASTDSSASSGSRGIEYNNNKIERYENKRKGDEIDCDIDEKRMHFSKCPMCDRDDFTTLRSLEVHLEENHPDYPARCSQCNQVFQNHKILAIHRSTFHSNDGGENGRSRMNSIIGFKNLTFVDFSSKKFAHIARYECEKNLHKAAAGLKFECNKCGRAFPCDKSLEIHATDCGSLDLSVANSNISESERKMRDYFSHLDLQQEATQKTAQRFLETIKSLDGSKDLADIQSIISMTTNGGISPYLQSNKNVETASATDSECVKEEETQDLFAQEFRKMKLRGEFPCRLCTAVFPNLRALKGHNRTHLNSTNNGTYRCNMCPHSSIDKAALIRHMRTHNGDRPYECAICNYAFTTKANCERHLRNRHAKTTRDEVKKSIIYHPSEDPTNDENKHNETKKFNLEATPEKIRNCSTPKSIFPTDITPQKPYILNEPINYHLQQPIKFSPEFTNTSTPQKPKIQVKNMQELKATTIPSDDEYEEENYEDQPLDLSKMKPEPREEVPEDFTKKNILAQQLLKDTPKIDQAALYASQFIYRNGFQFPNFPFNPLLFQTIQTPLLQQEQDKRLQLCSGGMLVENIAERFKSFYPQFQQQQQQPKLEKPIEINKPLTINTDTSSFSETIKSPLIQPKPQPALLQSPDSVKMVIKNGVLMPKQKQRRYRTERPFSCEYCSAKFTLRSNMERHIKQQHPQFWSQRQRSSVGNPGRKPQLTPLTIPSYEVQKLHDYEEHREPQSSISEKIKYAILAQHLKAAQESKRKEEDEDCALVIDEHEEAIKKEHAQKPNVFEINSNESRDRQLSEVKLQDVKVKTEETQDLVSVSRLLDNASQQPFKEYFKREVEEHDVDGISEEDEEGFLMASGSTSDGNSGTDERSEGENANSRTAKKKSAYSLAPNRVSCPYCSRKFPWTSSLRRHILTHTGQKPFKCSHCPLLFTTKSNCDRHLLRKHGNAATTMPNDSNSNFMMRNVPERPFKCSSCPSSTFSTYPNLKKHMSSKHGAQDDRQGYEAGSSEDEKNNSDQKSDWESQICQSKLMNGVEGGQQVTSNSDLPFKCHLCDSSFGDRQDCVDHIKDKHYSEYDLLMSKNALDANASTPDDSANNHDDDDNEIRGKFPDYSNRKVICAFCMRRFWSAEDLRRHMRTHTGERPFSCDICRRRFTLKHSMLRHRKKHNLAFGNDNDNVQSDDEAINEKLVNKAIVQSNKSSGTEKTDESDGTEGGSDLISNLLGIRDRSIIDQVLTASADDAAKLLGVGKQE